MLDRRLIVIDLIEPNQIGIVFFKKSVGFMDIFFFQGSYRDIFSVLIDVLVVN